MTRSPRYDKTRWEVARERFQIPDFAPPAPDPGAPLLGDFVAGALKGMKLTAHAQVTRIAADWPELVGPQIAANTRPAHLDQRILTVFVRHSGWLMELRGAATAEILARLQAKYGAAEIRNLRLSIDPGTAPG